MKIHRGIDEDKYKVKEDRKKAIHREKSYMDRHLYVEYIDNLALKNDET